jgi:hypothetical protein
MKIKVTPDGGEIRQDIEVALSSDHGVAEHRPGAQIEDAHEKNPGHDHYGAKPQHLKLVIGEGGGKEPPWHEGREQNRDADNKRGAKACHVGSFIDATRLDNMKVKKNMIKVKSTGARKSRVEAEPLIKLICGMGTAESGPAKAAFLRSISSPTGRQRGGLGHVEAGEVFGIDIVFFDLIGNLRLVEHSHRVGLLHPCLLFRRTATPDGFMPQTCSSTRSRPSFSRCL